jgi:hypothetical protein
MHFYKEATELLRLENDLLHGSRSVLCESMNTPECRVPNKNLVDSVQLDSQRGENQRCSKRFQEYNQGGPPSGLH